MAVGPGPQYEAIADAFLQHAQDGFYNAYIDRPACLGLLGDVAGARVLDAACGPGLYAGELVRRGAEVVGLASVPAWWRSAPSAFSLRGAPSWPS
jgi:SAM-dependent methyltransferase